MKYLIIGAPGTGKTTLACTGQHPTLLIDVDKKAESMKNLQHLISSGEVTIYPIKSKLVEDSLQYRAENPDKGPSKQPKGYLEIIEILNRIIENDKEFEPYKTIVLDSLTRVAEHLKRLLVYQRSKGKFGKADSDMNWPSWGTYLSNLEEIFINILTIDKDFICTAHEAKDEEKDGLTETRIIRGFYPMIDGQMKEKLPSYFNEVYYMDRYEDRKERTHIFRVRTQGNQKYHASTSMLLSEFEIPNLKKMIEKDAEQRKEVNK